MLQWKQFLYVKLLYRLVNFLNTIIFHVNVMKENTISVVHQTLMEMFNLVPESYLNFKKRKLRSLLPFVCTFAKGLFGVATMTDVNILATHINQLIK